jgi:16S rRNA (guanine527-N7)-methyltransferase
VSHDLDPLLIETLRQAQRFGFFGPGSIEQAADHAEAFVQALEPLDPGARVVDIGSGGGLPGLVLAAAFQHVSLTLIDRRQKRTDFLERAVARLGYHHVQVVCHDVVEIARSVDAGEQSTFDAVTARGFGPPEVTLRLAVRLVSPGGRIVISEPPSGDRWSPVLLASLGLTSTRRGAVRVFEHLP